MSELNSTPTADREVVIYAISRSTTPDSFRYVGKTAQAPQRRFRQHLLKNKLKTAKDCWLLRVGLDNATVRLTVLEVCNSASANSREIYWIARLKTDGHLLLNGTEGGDGGCKTEETKAKLSTALKGRVQSPEFCAKISAANKGKRLSAEHKLKIAAALSGRKRPPETIEKLRLAAIGNTYKRDAVKKRRLAQSLASFVG